MLGQQAADHELVQRGPARDEVAHGGGAYFFCQLSDASGLLDDSAVGAALWEVVWAGLVAGDSFAPVRALLSG
ncbi:hypothetical protein, partial [Nocardia farcinica]|uniref:hypothetical protein n=1 Tax=Nocardia farcinica TaxID=37329 RepID=UPI0024561B6C